MAYNPLLQTPTFSQLAQQQYQQTQNPAQGMSLSQLAQQAHNQFGSAYNAYAQQSMNQQMAAQQHMGRFNPNTWIEQRWQIDGKYMTLREFVDFIWPEDCADKTFFLLRYTKETNNETP